MANITNTLSKLLDTVGAVADSASKVVTSTTSGLDMLDAYVQSAKQKQEARIAVDMSTFYDDLQAETAFINAEKQTALNTALNGNNELKKNYDSEFAKLNDVIQNIKSKYNS